MPKMVQDFIRINGLDAIKQKYAIKVAQHKEFPHLHLFNYDMIDSPMSEEIVRRCRGLILDKTKDWGVVAYPFRKFFNAPEGHADKIDWSSAKVYEKLDGSLITMYWYGGWRVATRGRPDACGPVHTGAFSFEQLFWETWGHLRYGVPPPSYRYLCFMFELMTKHNRVVVEHPKPRIVLHGVRDLETMVEQEPEGYAEEFGWECVKSYPLTTLEEVVAASDALKGVDGEGFVVRDGVLRDGNFGRIKIKSTAYVALEHLRSSTSARSLLEIVRLGETAEVLAHFKEWQGEFDEITAKYNAWLAQLDKLWEDHKHLSADPKSFALALKDSSWQNVLCGRMRGKYASFKEYAAEIPVWRLQEYIGLNDKPLGVTGEDT